ncbi:MAG: hypothetical protein ACJ77B_10560 [Chloroflexota bacterium]
MSVGLRLVGQAAKRGVTHRIPAPDALMEDVEAWLRAEAADELDSVVRLPGTDEWAGLRLSLHPAAEDVELEIADGGVVMASAVTGEVGPGYHTYMCHLLRRLGTELSIAWAPADPAEGTGDATGSFESGRRADAEHAILGRLGETLKQAAATRAATRALGGQVQLLPSRGQRFEFEGAIATALGPRDDAWLSSAVANPRVAIDIVPWWTDATDGRYLLNRALCRMWTEIRWRPPTNDAERAVAEDVLTTLRRAFPLEPSLPYPWREWKELFDLTDTVDPMFERVSDEAARAPDAPLVGYRRRPVSIVHRGWTLTVPGSSRVRQTEEEAIVGDGDREITIAAVDTTSESGALPAETFLSRVGGELGSDVLRHRDGGVVGIARLAVDPSSVVEVAVLDGFSAVDGSGAAIRIVIHDPADWEWALDTWRALRPAS